LKKEPPGRYLSQSLRRVRAQAQGAQIRYLARLVRELLVGRRRLLTKWVARPLAARIRHWRCSLIRALLSWGLRKNCAALDLQGIDLRGLRLDGVSFHKANLALALLDGGSLCADYAGTVLRGATLYGIDLSLVPVGLDLRSTKLRAVHCSDRTRPVRFSLCGTDLQGAALSGANLCGADLRSADLRRADLRGALLEWADLGGRANLSGAILTGAVMFGANLARADLTGADLRGADLRYVNLAHAELHRADLTGADLRGASIGALEHDP